LPHPEQCPRPNVASLIETEVDGQAFSKPLFGSLAVAFFFLLPLCAGDI